MRLTAICPILLLTFAYAPNAVVCAQCDGTIAKCKEKGQEIWGKIASAKGDTDGISAKYAKYYQDLAAASQIDTAFNTGKRVKDLMAGVDLKVPARLTSVTIKGHSGSGAVAYENIYSEKLIAAINNFREEDPVEKENQVNWNVVAFEQYKKVATPASLTYVLRYNIVNTATNAVATAIYKAVGKEGDTTKDSTDWVMWTYAENADYILALLGTPNGSGAGYILIDYAETLNKKSIAAIYTRKFEGNWAMVVQFKAESTSESFLTSFLYTQHPIVRFVAGLLGTA
jgi:hypothetical protein